MKKFILLIAISLTYINVYAQVNDINKIPNVETSATVDSLVVPDRIYMNIRLDEKDTKGKVSIEEVEKRMEMALTSAGVNIKKQLSLSNAGSDFSKYFLRKKNVSKEKVYTLLVYDAKTLSKVLINLEKVNISNANLQKTEYSKAEELKIALRGKAVLKAKKQAEALVQPLNQKVGYAFVISDQSPQIETQGWHPRNKVARGLLNMTSDISNTDFNKIRVTASVRIRFHLH